MNTPITAAADDYQIRSVAQKLERDRAALMEALELTESYLIERGIATRGTTGRTVVLPKIQSALAAARDNFPQP